MNYKQDNKSDSVPDRSQNTGFRLMQGSLSFPEMIISELINTIHGSISHQHKIFQFKLNLKEIYNLLKT